MASQSLSQETVDNLLQVSQKALQHAIAPSSKFRVGSALLGKSGNIYAGCNIESPVYLGLCAERLALFKGLSEGEREFIALAVSCEEDISFTPCGTCRQLLWEFAPFLQIILLQSSGDSQIHSIQNLLPIPFERGERNPYR
jgi:cytidine deaminase